MKKSVIRILCFCVILAGVLNYVNHVFKVKYEEGVYGVKKFYELEKNTVDVLILGSSHAFENFNTGVLWDEYGIASFVLGGAMQPMWNSYHYLKEALKTQRPGLIVLEAYTTAYDSEFMEDSRIIQNTYGLKWSKNKVDAIKISAPKDRWSEFLLDYSQYHTRYTELSRADFFDNQGTPRYKDWKGFRCNMRTKPMKAQDVTKVTEKENMYEKAEKYYRMIIELAQEEEIPLLVVISPYAGVTSHAQSIFNSTEEIAEEYQVPFVNYNLLVDDLGIDFSTDAADKAHLNYRGNQKYTHAVGAYIKENFNIPDRRGEADYQSWQREADYISHMIENQQLTEAETVEELAPKLSNQQYCLAVSVDGTASLEDAGLRPILEAAGIQPGSGGNTVYYRDNGEGSVWNIGMGETEFYLKWDYHDLCMKRKFKESSESYVNTMIVDHVEYQNVANGVNVVVYDKVTQSVVDSFGIDSQKGYKVKRKK